MHCGPGAKKFVGRSATTYLIGPGAVEVLGSDIPLALQNNWVQVPQPPDGSIKVRVDKAQKLLQAREDVRTLTAAIADHQGTIAGLQVQLAAAQKAVQTYGETMQ